MPQHQSRLQLSKQELNTLHSLLHKGRYASRTLYRARILLLLHEGKKKTAIARELNLGRSTVQRTHRRYRKNGLEAALFELPRSGQPKKLSEKAQAHLVALACSDPPEGRDHWTLELLQQRMIRDRQVETVSTVCLWHSLTQRGIKPWLEKNVVCAEGYSGVC